MQPKSPKSTLAKPEPSPETTNSQPLSGMDGDISAQIVLVTPQTPTSHTHQTSFGWRIVSIVASVWLLAIVLIWLWLHAPFMPPLLSALNASEVASTLFSTIINLLLLPLMALAATASGLRLLGWVLPPKILNKGESLVVACGLGLGAIGFLVLGFGVSGFLDWPMAYGLLLGSLILNFRQTEQILSYLQQTWQSGRKWGQNSNWVSRLLIIYIGLILGLTLCVSLLPPTAWDSLMYHLAAPKLYLQNHQIGPLNQITTTTYPFGMEMLFTWAMALHNDSLAQAVHWLFGLLTAITLILMTNRFFDGLNPAQRQLTGLLAASFYLSIPLVQTLLTWAYTDLLLTFYALLTLYILLLILKSKFKTQDWLRLTILAGVMGGLCFGGKYWSVLSLAGAGLAFLVVGTQEKVAARRLWGSFIVFGLITLLVASPWLIRNWFFSDNPIAPFMFGVRGWDKAELTSFNTAGGVLFDLPGLITLPWKLTINGQTGGQFDATISPLFLGLAPLTIFAAIRERLACRVVVIVIAVEFITWVVAVSLNSNVNETRAIAPMFPLLALITAYGVVVTIDVSKTLVLHNFVKLIISVYLATNLFNQIIAVNDADALPVLMGLRARDIYLETTLGSYWRAARFINNQLPAQAHLATWLEPRSYYLERATQPDVFLDKFFYYFSHYPNPEQLAGKLKEQGVTHILISERGLTFLANIQEYNRVADVKAAQPVLAELKAKYLTLLYEEPGQYALYALH